MSRLSMLALCLAAACVSLQRGGLFAPERDEVFLSYFDNDTFFRDLQFELTERIKDEIVSRPGLKLTSKETAEILLGGRIVDVRQRVLSENPRRTVTSQSSSITVLIEVTDARSGAIIKTTRLTRRGQYVPDRGETIEDARAESIRFLARDIVRELEEGF